jgi:quercetin dioxygenase-like cupin family protein
MELEVKLREISGDFVNLDQSELIPLVNEHGEELPGIRGRKGVKAIRVNGEELGVDLIEMDVGSAFPLHTHPGDHILFVLEGQGGVVINGEFHRVVKNDSIFIAAEYPHGVRGPVQPEDAPFRFLAVGIPHMELDSRDRMKLVLVRDGLGS